MSICTMKELVFVICLYCLPELVVLYKILQTLIVEETHIHYPCPTAEASYTVLFELLNAFLHRISRDTRSDYSDQ